MKLDVFNYRNTKQPFALMCITDNNHDTNKVPEQIM